MRVRMRSLYAGQSGVLANGEVYDLDESFASQLVRAGAAEVADPDIVERRTATYTAPVNADARARRKRGRQAPSADSDPTDSDES